MPTSLFALILFVCFATPGFVFEMLRERRRPPRVYSALRETSVIVVASVVFTLPAVLVLLLVFPGETQALQGLADQPSKYAAAHLAGVVALIVAMVALATFFAAIWDVVLQRIQGRPLVTREPVWLEVLNGRARPANKKAVALLSVDLKDGACIEGAIKAHGLNKDQETDWLVLYSHSQWPLRSRSPAGQFEKLEGWDYMVISADEIRAASVSYFE